MRSRLGRRTARLAHAAAHDGHGQTGCHVVQPGSRRSSQRSDCQRDRRIRRPNGPVSPTSRPFSSGCSTGRRVRQCGAPGRNATKTRFSEEWRRTLENTWNLYIWQDAATELLFAPAPKQTRRRRTICPTKPQRRSIPRPARFLRQPNRMRIQIRHSEMHRRPPENSPSGAFGPAWASNFPAGKSYSPPAHSSEE